MPGIEHITKLLHPVPTHYTSPTAQISTPIITYIQTIHTPNTLNTTPIHPAYTPIPHPHTPHTPPPLL